jgi:hypothetical protein
LYGEERGLEEGPGDIEIGDIVDGDVVENRSMERLCGTGKSLGDAGP